MDAVRVEDGGRVARLDDLALGGVIDAEQVGREDREQGPGTGDRCAGRHGAPADAEPRCGPHGDHDSEEQRGQERGGHQPLIVDPPDLDEGRLEVAREQLVRPHAHVALRRDQRLGHRGHSERHG